MDAQSQRAKPCTSFCDQRRPEVIGRFYAIKTILRFAKSLRNSPRSTAYGFYRSRMRAIIFTFRSNSRIDFHTHRSSVRSPVRLQCLSRGAHTGKMRKVEKTSLPKAWPGMINLQTRHQRSAKNSGMRARSRESRSRSPNFETCVNTCDSMKLKRWDFRDVRRASSSKRSGCYEILAIELKPSRARPSLDADDTTDAYYDACYGGRNANLLRSARLVRRSDRRPRQWRVRRSRGRRGDKALAAHLEPSRSKRVDPK